ncbi:MAG: hypothetical protein LQ346_000409 [Caloplaca aetnensis]|nr:MAG: hypothetical protein LQ346_000409 [Caloplaca aetnensis]
MSQQSQLSAGQSWDSETNPTALSSEPALKYHERRTPSPTQAPFGDIDRSDIAAPPNNRVDTLGGPSMNRDLADQGREQYDQGRGVHSPDTPSSVNRTPTQADYTDYLRRGSSPSAKIPRENQTREDEAIQDPLPRLQPNGPVSPPPPQSKYSAQAQRGALWNSTKQLASDQNGAWVDQSALPRASDDPAGTYRIAESAWRGSSGTDATSSGPRAFGAVPGQPAESHSQGSTNNTLSSSPQSIPSPPADGREQSRARPFSFVRFSQSPALMPLEDYSHRQPSIDSTASKIDPSDDIPPSPMSTGHSVGHTEIDHSEKKDPVQDGTVDDVLPYNEHNLFSHEPPSLRQPYQTSLEDQPAFRRDEAGLLNKAANLPAGHSQAPIPRQEAIVPGQEGSEYSPEGVRPPLPRPRNSTSTSKRGSRSSAFFRSFKTTPNETSTPQLTTENDGQAEGQSQEHDDMRKSKSKRGSLFRSLTGGKAKPGEGNPAEPSNDAQAAVVPDHPKPAVEPLEKPGDWAKGPSKYRNRLSRNATAKMEEQQRQEGSKKNRFSAIGVSEPICDPSLPSSTAANLVQSLFGRSKDQRARKAGIDPPQPISQEAPLPEVERPQKRNSQVSSSKKAGRGEGAPTQAEHPGDPTMSKLARQGFLTKEPVFKSPKPSGSSAVKRDSMQRQQQFPPRHQSLGHGSQRSGQDWSTEHSSNSMNTPSQQSAASIPRQQTLPVQQHRVQSSVTTRSTTRQSGPPQSYQSPRQFSSTTTTITTSRNPKPNPSSRQQQQLPQGKHSSRSDSPPPPPPPPKDAWHQSKSHQRSLSNLSSISAARPSSDKPSQAFNFGVAKDTEYQPNLHHRSTSTNSSTEPVRTSYGTPSQGYSALKGPLPPLNSAQTTDTASPHLHPYHPSPQPSRVFNVPKGVSPPLNTPQTAGASSYHLHPYPANPQPSRVFNVPKSSFTTSPPQDFNPTDSPSQPSHSHSASVPSRQSLPALQTTMPSSSPPPLKPQGQSNGASEPDARNFRRSQIEGPAQPIADRTLASPAAHPSRTLTTTTSTSGASGVRTAHEGQQQGSHGRSTEDEPIIMSATSFPGQEWQPSYGWDGE